MTTSSSQKCIAYICEQWILFCLALAFLTRIPIPRTVPYSPQRLSRSSRYFSLVGYVLAILLSLIAYGLTLVFDNTLVVFFVIVLSLLLTGVFHEDGLADTCDGLGGAFERHRKLVIMKDSRLGTYGAVALVMALLGKYLLLIQQPSLLIALLIAYPVSRAIAISLLFDTPYVADELTSKSKPLATQLSFSELLFVIVIAAVSLLFLLWWQMLLMSIVLVLVRYALRYYFVRQLGGYTGDVLGAVQQLTELIVYSLLIAFNAFV